MSSLIRTVDNETLSGATNEQGRPRDVDGSYFYLAASLGLVSTHPRIHVMCLFNTFHLCGLFLIENGHGMVWFMVVVII